jgi:hypothetical protein
MTNKYLPWLHVSQISELPLGILVELAEEANLEAFNYCEIELALDVVQDWLLEKSVYGGDTRYILG